MLEPTIVFEDESILVLDKPSGWVVNDAKTAHGNPILQNWLKENFSYELSDNVEKRSGIVHRLDKETSGLLVIAKTAQVFNNLQKQFKDRVVKKSYIALVHGKVRNTSGVISASVGRLPWNRERFGVITSGKSAETGYDLINLYKDASGNYYSLLKLSPKTGRTHQIRIHLKYLGHPVVSDSFYAGRKTSRKDRVWCKRLFLHAGKITLTHPIKKVFVSCESPIPEDLLSSLSGLIPV